MLWMWSPGRRHPANHFIDGAPLSIAASAGSGAFCSAALCLSWYSICWVNRKVQGRGSRFYLLSRLVPGKSKSLRTCFIKHHHHQQSHSEWPGVIKTSQLGGGRVWEFSVVGTLKRWKNVVVGTTRERWPINSLYSLRTSKWSLLSSGGSLLLLFLSGGLYEILLSTLRLVFYDTLYYNMLLSHHHEQWLGPFQGDCVLCCVLIPLGSIITRNYNKVAIHSPHRVATTTTCCYTVFNTAPERAP